MAKRISAESESLVTQGVPGDRAERRQDGGIETHNGEAAFAITRRPAWHRLGTVIEDEFMTSEKALEVARLADWNVSTVPLVAVVDGVEYAVDSKNVQLRTNPFTGRVEPLGVVGDRYTNIQNEEAFVWTDALADNGARYVSAGSLYNGRKVFMCQQLADSYSVDGTDDVAFFLVTTTTHDGTGAMESAVTPIQAACQNTVRIGRLRAARKWKVRHTASAMEKREEAKRALGLAAAYIDEFDEFAESLTRVEVAPDAFSHYVKQLFPVKPDAAKKTVTQMLAKRATFEGLYFNSPTLDEKFRGAKKRPGKAWGVLHAITEYEDWFSQVQMRGAADKDKVRAVREIGGDEDLKFKDRATNLLLDNFVTA